MLAVLGELSQGVDIEIGPDVTASADIYTKLFSHL
jgi:hypothetical protein